MLRHWRVRAEQPRFADAKPSLEELPAQVTRESKQAEPGLLPASARSVRHAPAHLTGWPWEVPAVSPPLSARVQGLCMKRAAV